MWAFGAGEDSGDPPPADRAVVTYFGFRLHLVPIVAFLLTGVAIGPNALGLVDELEVVNAAAEIGVLLLLHTIGLESSLARLKELEGHSLICSGQPGETWVYCFPDAMMLGGRNPDSVERAPVS